MYCPLLEEKSVDGGGAQWKTWKWRVKEDGCKVTSSLLQRLSLYHQAGAAPVLKRTTDLMDSDKTSCLIPNCLSQKYFNCKWKKPTRAYLSRKGNWVGTLMNGAGLRNFRDLNTIIHSSLPIPCSWTPPNPHPISQLCFCLYIYFITPLWGRGQIDTFNITPEEKKNSFFLKDCIAPAWAILGSLCLFLLIGSLLSQTLYLRGWDIMIGLL